MMKLLNKFKVLVLVFAAVAMVFGFVAFTAPNNANAVWCTAWCMYCTVNPPFYCWCECCGW
ncbi:MAG: hypothetical protein GTO24_19790 [candidate division Zixibacteria bacterium]|nr:hypothetical protein [candidate division Zixibacteria bacterium]